MAKGISIVVIVLLLIIGVYSFYHIRRYQYPLPKTMASVDLSKYTGTWYEIALIPNHFEKGCQYTKAVYTEEKDIIKVTNSCTREQTGKKSVVHGKAWSADPSNSKLKVQFFWPFKGDYWIMYVDENYRYAIVGGPARKYLWILARDTTIPQNIYDHLKEMAKQQGFDVSRLVKTVQK